MKTGFRDIWLSILFIDTHTCHASYLELQIMFLVHTLHEFPHRRALRVRMLPKLTWDLS